MFYRQRLSDVSSYFGDLFRIEFTFSVFCSRTNLYLALFTLMGCYKVFQIANMFWGHPIYIKFSLTLGMLHGILTFLIFVWKDDVKRSFRSQITIMFRKWVACRQPHTTPVTKNDNENLWLAISRKHSSLVLLYYFSSDTPHPTIFALYPLWFVLQVLIWSQ